MSDYELTTSLAIRHPDIDPDRITRALGFQPWHVWRKGELPRVLQMLTPTAGA